MGAVIDGVLHVPGPLTFATVCGCFRDFGELLSAPGGLTAIDLEKAIQVDSAGLALLLEWQSMAMRKGNRVEIRNAPRDLLRLAALCEATALLGLMPVPGLASAARNANPA